MRNPRLKKLYFFCSSFVIFLVHLPFVFAKSKPSDDPAVTPKIHSWAQGQLLLSTLTSKMSTSAGMLYDSMRLNVMGLSQQAFNCAVQGFNYLAENGRIANKKIISVIDFSLPSSSKRLFVIDMEHCKVLFNTYVAHGSNSGKEYATHFSNTPESNQSSLGFYETLGTYMGDNGLSLKLDGLERGFNDNANRRAIVVHGAAYVSESFINAQGYIGRSWGCPALPQNLYIPIINKIKNGTGLFIYSPDRNYLSHSNVLRASRSTETASL